MSRRVDLIMLKDPYPENLPLLRKCGIFGRAISKETGLSARDYYGVYRGQGRKGLDGYKNALWITGKCYMIR